MHHAARLLNPEAVPALLDKGADPNITDNDGLDTFTPCLLDNPEAVPALLDKVLILILLIIMD